MHKFSRQAIEDGLILFSRLALTLFLLVYFYSFASNSGENRVCAKFELVRFGIISWRQAVSHKSSIISLRWTLGRTLVYDFIFLLLRPELTRVHKLVFDTPLK